MHKRRDERGKSERKRKRKRKEKRLMQRTTRQ
jgi:hypothetical protein